MIAWKKSEAQARLPLMPTAAPASPTAQSVSYSPRDGVTKGPFTTVEGCAEKHTGKDPFIIPANLLAAIKEQRYGIFRSALGTVPVDLTSADTTGGNSGSAVMNKRGELIGLNFDSTYESIKDWY